MRVSKTLFRTVREYTTSYASRPLYLSLSDYEKEMQDPKNRHTSLTGELKIVEREIIKFYSINLIKKNKWSMSVILWFWKSSQNGVRQRVQSDVFTNLNQLNYCCNPFIAFVLWIFTLWCDASSKQLVWN